MQKTVTFLTFLLFSTLIYAQDGTLDATFGTNGKLTTAVTPNNDKPRDMLVQPDNKIIVGGDVSVVFGDTVYMSLVRYNSNGTIDNTFGTNGKVTTGFADGICAIRGLALQADGKIIAVGFFTTLVNGVGTNIDFAIVRYNPNGTLDTSFDGDGRVTTNFNSSRNIAYAVAVQADGKIVVVGDSRQLSIFTLQTVIARYNTNGSLDTSFNGTGKSITTTEDDNIYQFFSVTLSLDNKIIVGKRSALSVQGGSLVGTRFTRYNSNGTLDTSFGNNGWISEVGQSPVHKALSNGKLLIVSNIYNPTTNSSFKLLRFKSNGSIDSAFGINGTVMTLFNVIGVSVDDILEQKDGKIVVSGSFSGFSSAEPFKFGVVRYLENGDLDNTFGSGGKSMLSLTYSGERYIKLGIQKDGKLINCGYHTDPTNKYNFVVARLNNTIVGVKNVAKNTPLSIFPNPTTNVLNIDFKEPITDAVKLTITDISGRIVYQQNYDKILINNDLQINISDLAAGFYVVTIVSDKENISRVIVKQ